MLGKMYCSQQLAMYSEAVLIYKQAIDIYTQMYGADHYHTLNVLLELS